MRINEFTLDYLGDKFQTSALKAFGGTFEQYVETIQAGWEFSASEDEEKEAANG